MKNFETVKEKILDRTLYLIGKNGTTNVSVREIAQASDVNIAAINYHFQSKELMLAQMEELFIDNFRQVYDILDDDSMTDIQRLSKWMDEIMAYTLHYPGIMIVIREKMLDINSEMGQYLRVAIYEKSEKVKKLIRNISPIADSTEVGFTETIIISSLVYPAMNHPDNTFLNSHDFHDAQTRKEYIDYLLGLIKEK